MLRITLKAIPVLLLIAGNASLVMVLQETHTLVGITAVSCFLLLFNGFVLGFIRLASKMYNQQAEPAQWQEPTEARTKVLLSLILGSLTIWCLHLGYSDPKASKTQIPDLLTGWKTAPDYRCVIETSLYGRVEYSSSANGFRKWGNIHSGRNKLLVLGNSPTQAIQVSDGSAYYEYFDPFGENFEVFAYGCGGYGTLQEYLILDIFAELIKPDVVLWQMTGNDLVYNLHAIESKSFFKNQHVVRPYWEGNQAVYHYSREYPFHLEILEQVSPLFRLCLVHYDNLLFTHDRNKMFERTLHPGHPLFLEAVQVTETLLSKARRGLPLATFFAFCTDSDEIFPRVARNAGMIYIPGVSTAVSRAFESGQKVDGRPLDAHWNALGHRIAGEFLRDEMKFSSRSK